MEENGNVQILLDSDSVALITALMTPIFYFHKTIGALTIPLTILTPTPALMKTSLFFLVTFNKVFFKS